MQALPGARRVIEGFVMRWIGLNDGYVSGDGLFLVAPVQVEGRRGVKKMWVVYGLVRIDSSESVHVPWTWTEQPLHGPVETKRSCQEWAVSSGYTARVLAHGEVGELSAVDRPVGYEYCVECGVRFARNANHPYLDYCGGNCFGHVVDRVADIRGRLEGAA